MSDERSVINSAIYGMQTKIINNAHLALGYCAHKKFVYIAEIHALSARK